MNAGSKENNVDLFLSALRKERAQERADDQKKRDEERADDKKERAQERADDQKERDKQRADDKKELTAFRSEYSESTAAQNAAAKAFRTEVQGFIKVEANFTERAVQAAAQPHFEAACSQAGLTLHHLGVRKFSGVGGTSVETDAYVVIGALVLGAVAPSRPLLAFFVEGKYQVTDEDVRETLRRMGEFAAHFALVSVYLEECRQPGGKARAEEGVLEKCLAAAKDQRHRAEEKKAAKVKAEAAVSASSGGGPTAAPLDPVVEAVSAAEAAEKMAKEIALAADSAAAAFRDQADILEPVLKGLDLSRLRSAAAAGAKVAQELGLARGSISGDELKALRAAGLDTLTGVVQGYLGGKGFPLKVQEQAKRVGLHPVVMTIPDKLYSVI